MKLSKTTEYTLRMLIFMAKDPDAIYSAKQLVNELKVPNKYIRQLMTDISKAGFIKSIQGREGGYKFQKDINDIFLFDIINAVEGKDKFNGCLLGFEKCSSTDPCALHAMWEEKKTDLNNFFKSTKLSDMDYNKAMHF